VQLDFSLRAVTARTVVLHHDGREIWRAAVGPTRSHHTVTVRSEHGRASLAFFSDTPPQREGPHANARDLSFALYDLRLTLTEP
jgi:hypothetical protein